MWCPILSPSPCRPSLHVHAVCVSLSVRSPRLPPPEMPHFPDKRRCQLAYASFIDTLWTTMAILWMEIGCRKPALIWTPIPSWFIGSKQAGTVQ